VSPPPCILPNSGRKTSVMPRIPSVDPAAIFHLIGVPKKTRIPSMPSSGLAE
jgi:hypothetical protein